MKMQLQLALAAMALIFSASTEAMDLSNQPRSTSVVYMGQINFSCEQNQLARATVVPYKQKSGTSVEFSYRPDGCIAAYRIGGRPVQQRGNITCIKNMDVFYTVNQDPEFINLVKQYQRTASEDYYEQDVSKILGIGALEDAAECCSQQRQFTFYSLTHINDGFPVGSITKCERFLKGERLKNYRQ